MLLAKRNDYSESRDVTVEQVMDRVMDIRDRHLNSLLSAENPADAEAIRQRIIVLNEVLDIPDLVRGTVS